MANDTGVNRILSLTLWRDRLMEFEYVNPVT